MGGGGVKRNCFLVNIGLIQLPFHLCWLWFVVDVDGEGVGTLYPVKIGKSQGGKNIFSRF